MDGPSALWRPDATAASKTELARFSTFLGERYGLHFEPLDYTSLHRWSVEHLDDFWAAFVEFSGVLFHDRAGRVRVDDGDMATVRWFPGATLNYAEHVLLDRDGHRDTDLAVLFEREDGVRESLTYGELRARVAAARAGLLDLGVKAGDRVVALAPNCVETIVVFLATASLGAVWACCSPDFGAKAVEDRFRQLAPTVLVAVDGYLYNGRRFELAERIERLRAALPSLRATVGVPYLGDGGPVGTGIVSWEEFTSRTAPLEYEALPFEHPLWVLYSSGTTGLPKGIVHSHGGIVVEHLKVLGLLSDLRPGDVFFWFTTTGWMMWNYLLGGLLVGSTIVCYDGNPMYPGPDRLWALAAEYRVRFFGVSSPFLHAAMRAGERPREKFDLGGMEMIGATGSPLSPEGFRWISENVGKDVQIFSNSGGTDVCTPFVMSAPTVPVWTGEISCAALGVEVEAFDPGGRAVVDEVGELVVTTPMPSMPVFFWNDQDGSRLREAYFSDFPGVWRHGDWVRKTSRGSYIIYGRSDSTLNRGGVRMGTAEFYSVVEAFPEVEDSLVVDVSTTGSGEQAPLLCFLVLGEGADEGPLVERIRRTLRTELSPRHVPDRFIRVDAVPKTLNGKKCEVPVKRILLGASVEQAVSRSALQNPDSIDEFATRRAEFTAPVPVT